jgi:SpoVK/Ycf46/Vps4 family AAA+-type ATPase
MKRRHKKSGFTITLPGSSRRKWAKRGRGVGDFIMSLLFSVSEHIVDAGIRCTKRAGSGIAAMHRKRSQNKAAQKSRSPILLAAAQSMFTPVDKSKIQKVRFNDVVGLAGAKKEIRIRAMTPLQHMDKARLLKIVEGGGVLLVGPPGNGKSMLAKAVANEANMTVFEITAADILKSSQEASVKRVQELFRTVRRYKRVVIIINEIGGFLRKSNSNIQQSVNSQFLNETSGFLGENGSDNVLLMVGTSNIPEIMRAALKRTGRFDEVIFVGLPLIDERRNILVNSMDGVPAADDIDFDLLAERTRLFSGADLADGLVQKAKREALLRSTGLPKGQVMPVCIQDFMTALEGSGPSVSDEDLTKWYPNGLDALT